MQDLDWHGANCGNIFAFQGLLEPEAFGHVG